jgi:pectate lyase
MPSINQIKKPFIIGLFISLLATIVPPSKAVAHAILPGVKGFGMQTPAGRGGRIIPVTNLNSSGKGSFKAAIQASGPRIVVFQVSGAIVYNGRYKIKNPFITIAGQTAPSPGITLQGATLTIDTHDVLIQHIRVRTGDGIRGVEPDNRDGINIGLKNPRSELYNIVVDHCSVSWSIDEAIEIFKCSDVTFRNCIISEPLSHSLHSKGEHSKAMLIGRGAKRISILENLFAHSVDRNPVIQSGVSAVVVNNLIFNPGDFNIRVSSVKKASEISIVGNVTIKGKDTRYNAARKMPSFWGDPAQGTLVFLADNQCHSGTPSSSDDWSFVENDTSLSAKALRRSIKASTPTIWIEGLSAMPSSRVKEYLLSNAGARPKDRDAIDRRIIADVRRNSGRIIDTPSAVGGWPQLKENRIALVLPPDPNGDTDGDGYTNVEEWLHESARTVEIGHPSE